MLVESRKNIKDCAPADALRVADFLCHACPDVRRIFECVKVYARIHESGCFTYARHPHDLGTTVVTAENISSRMKDPSREKAVKDALHVVENNCAQYWPFSAGSSSWILLEILHPSIRIKAKANEPTVVFRKAARVSPKGVQTTTSLLERLFSSMILPESCDSWNLEIDPVIQLTNTSGTGIFTRLREQFEGVAVLEEGDNQLLLGGLDDIATRAINEFTDDLLFKNFDGNAEQAAGFYFSFNNEVYQVRSKRPAATKKVKPLSPPLQVFGLIR